MLKSFDIEPQGGRNGGNVLVVELFHDGCLPRIVEAAASLAVAVVASATWQLQHPHAVTAGNGGPQQQLGRAQQQLGRDGVVGMNKSHSISRRISCSFSFSLRTMVLKPIATGDGASSPAARKTMTARAGRRVQVGVHVLQCGLANPPSRLPAATHLSDLRRQGQPLELWVLSGTLLLQLATGGVLGN